MDVSFSKADCALKRCPMLVMILWQVCGGWTIKMIFCFFFFFGLISALVLLVKVHGQLDQPIRACRSIGERGPKVESRKLTHLCAAPVLIKWGGKEGNIKSISRGPR